MYTTFRCALEKEKPILVKVSFEGYIPAKTKEDQKKYRKLRIPKCIERRSIVRLVMS